MAEICLDCYNKELAECNKPILTEKEVVLDDDLCESCGEIKPCIIVIKEKNIIKEMFRRIRVLYYRIKYR
jgi:hypothetical protein